MSVQSMKTLIKQLVIAGCVTASHMASAQTMLQVNSNANQFPYITVKVHAFDSKSGNNVKLTKEDLLVSEDLSTIDIESFKTLTGSSSAAQKVDVMFVFDQTGSMSEEIAGLVEKTRHFADLIAQSGINYRLGLVSFSDKAVEKQFAYTDNAAAFKENVSTLSAAGGDDEPENQLDSLLAAAKLPMRADAKHVFILVTDASYHFQDSVSSHRPEEIINTLKTNKVQLHVVGPELDAYKKMSQALQGNFYDKDSDDFTSIVANIGGDISSNYEFSYLSPHSQRDGTRRSVRVAIKGKPTNDASQYIAPWFVTASSRQDGLMGEESNYAPYKVLDGNAGSAWTPSEIGTANQEWLHLDLPVARVIQKITLTTSNTPFSDNAYATITMDGKDIAGVRSKDGKTITFSTITPAPVNKVYITLHTKDATRIGLAEVNAYMPNGELIPEILAHHINVSGREAAKSLNAKGEIAYHAGKIKESTRFYESALSANPNCAQCYSNLGLSYWKLGMYADSVTANRSAIALGKQQGNTTVIANSYYNIAKTFEAQKEYKQALMNFWWANKTVSKPVYINAIQRMNALIAKEAE